MDDTDLAQAEQLIEKLAGRHVSDGREAEALFRSIIAPVLHHRGYAVRDERFAEDRGVDIVAVKNDEDSIAIELKYSSSGRPVGMNAVLRMIGFSRQPGFKNHLILSSSGFTEEAYRAIQEAAPSLSAGDLDTLRAWIAAVRPAAKPPSSAVVELVSQMARGLIRLIASNRMSLWQIEWRDLERTLAAAFEGLGFDVVLTPPSKDGGKDVILSCVEKGTRRSYIVEIKHWVAGKRVGGSVLRKFVSVVVNEKHDSGLFLSTSGFAGNAFEALSQIEYRRLRAGAQEKIVGICETYVKAESGLWAPQRTISELLYEGTELPSPGMVPE